MASVVGADEEERRVSAIALARPSVVSIRTYKKSSSEPGIGSGVIVRSNGVVLTNFHVIKNADVKNTVWLTADVHYTAAHHYSPERAVFKDFTPFWEFVSGPIHAGTFGPGELDNTFGPRLEFVKAPLPSYSRYIALYHTPQEAGGCKGCRFFSMCKGHCPGTSLEGDWRFRTEHCQVWKKMFELAEEEALAEGKTPLSQHPARPYLEKRLVEGWSRGQNYALQSLIRELAQKPQMATV